jgi:exo-1,4-beta-D-glucosaminidase
VVAAASDNSSPISGSSGMKMTGPYDWIPPNYWYAKREGGATGFNSETSAGPDIPTLDTLRRMMTPAELATLWKDPSAKQYHRSPSPPSTPQALRQRAHRPLRPPTSLDRLRPQGAAGPVRERARPVRGVRAQRHRRLEPATGVIYWMFNSGWTSLHWQLLDRYLDQGGAYFGAKKANEPLHIQYSYDNRSVVVVNNRNASALPTHRPATLFNTDGTQKYDKKVTGVKVSGDGAHSTALTLALVGERAVDDVPGGWS